MRKEQNAPNQPFSSHIQPDSEPYEHTGFCAVVVLGKRQIINHFALEMIHEIALYQYDQFQIGFDQAEAYRKSVGQYLRKNQWDNVTVEVFI